MLECALPHLADNVCQVDHSRRAIQCSPQRSCVQDVARVDLSPIARRDRLG